MSDIKDRSARDDDVQICTSSVAGGCCCFSVLFVLCFVVPFIITTMPDTERGVAYSRIFARFQDEVLESGGIHSKPYNAEIIRWPRTEKTVEFVNPKLVCNSKDGLLIDMQITLQYFPEQDQLPRLTKDFSTFDRWEKLLIKQAESTIRNVCGDFVADDFQTNRGAVAAAMETGVRTDCASRYYAVITKLQLRDFERPLQYEEAVKNKENARSEIALAKNEEIQAVIKAETKIDVANEERIRILDTANTTALIKKAQGENEAESILNQFEQLISVYESVKTSRGLTTKGILSYISNAIFSSDITIAVGAPAEISFKDEL